MAAHFPQLSIFFERLLKGRVSAATLRLFAYAAVMFGSSAMNNLFVTYYIDLFSRHVRVTVPWFFAGQVIFMLWNAANDPLFGWLSDNSAFPPPLSSASSSVSPSGAPTASPKGAGGLARRTLAIGFGGTLWCLAFLAIWFPWAVHAPPAPGVPEDGPWTLTALLAGLHFVASLCTYDGMLTYVEVNHSALLAEMTQSGQERSRANALAGVAAAVGSCTSFLAYLAYSPNDWTAFRVVTVVVAVASALAFQFSAWGIEVTTATTTVSAVASSAGEARIGGLVTSSGNEPAGTIGSPGAARADGSGRGSLSSSEQPCKWVLDGNDGALSSLPSLENDVSARTEGAAASGSCVNRSVALSAAICRRGLILLGLCDAGDGTADQLRRTSASDVGSATRTSLLSPVSLSVEPGRRRVHLPDERFVGLNSNSTPLSPSLRERSGGGGGSQAAAGVPLFPSHAAAASVPLGEGGAFSQPSQRYNPDNVLRSGRCGTDSWRWCRCSMRSDYFAFLKQLVSSRSLLTFAALSFLQTFDCTFEKNFFVPFMDALALPRGAELGGPASPALVVPWGFSGLFFGGLGGGDESAFHNDPHHRHDHVHGHAMGGLGLPGSVLAAGAAGLVESHNGTSPHGSAPHSHLGGAFLHPLLHRSEPETQAAAIRSSMLRALEAGAVSADTVGAAKRSVRPEVGAAGVGALPARRLLALDNDINAHTAPRLRKGVIYLPPIPRPPARGAAPVAAAAAGGARATVPLPATPVSGGAGARVTLVSASATPSPLPAAAAAATSPTHSEAFPASSADGNVVVSADRGELAAPFPPLGSSSFRAICIFLSFLLPHTLTVLWTPFIERRGLHLTLQLIFGIRLALLAFVAFVGRSSPIFVVLVMLANRVMSESVCRLFPLVLSDLIDEDAALHARPKSLSASLVGSVSCVSRLGQSLAPLFVLSVLPESDCLFSAPSHGNLQLGGASGLFSEGCGELIWTLLLVVPSICVALQLACWSSCYVLRGRYLSTIKARIAHNQSPSS